jgi:hypothetical protein
LENGVKYTPPGDGIEITAEEEKEGVIVSVADSGPGLASGEEKRWMVEAIREGLQAADAGDLESEEEVRAVLTRWGVNLEEGSVDEAGPHRSE